jgi:hypothetical protein
MKNLPENEWMKELESRLQKYEEQPDEAVWSSITRAVQTQREAAVWKWLDYAGSMAVVLLAVFVLSNGGERPSLVSGAPEKAENKKITENAIIEVTPLKNLLPANTHMADIRLQENKNGGTQPLYTNDRQIIASDKILEETSITVALAGSPIEELDRSLATKNDMTAIVLDTVPDKKEDARHDTLALPDKKEKIEKAKNKRERKPITLYAQLTPSLSYYALQPFGNDQTTISSFNSSSVLSTNRFGIGGEVGIQGMLVKKFLYTAGFSFYQQKQTLRYQTVNSSKNAIVNSPSNAFSYSTTPQHNQHVVIYDMANVGVTVGLLYELKNAGLIHRIGLSGSYQQGFKQSTEEGTFNNANSSYAFYNFLYRIEHPINKKLKLYLQPTYSRGFYVNEKLKEPFSLKPSRAGLSIGIVVDF